MAVYIQSWTDPREQSLPASALMTATCLAESAHSCGFPRKARLAGIRRGLVGKLDDCVNSWNEHSHVRTLNPQTSASWTYDLRKPAVLQSYSQDPGFRQTAAPHVKSSHGSRTLHCPVLYPWLHRTQDTFEESPKPGHRKGCPVTCTWNRGRPVSGESG